MSVTLAHFGRSALRTLHSGDEKQAQRNIWPGEGEWTESHGCSVWQIVIRFIIRKLEMCQVWLFQISNNTLFPHRYRVFRRHLQRQEEVRSSRGQRPQPGIHRRTRARPQVSPETTHHKHISFIQLTQLWWDVPLLIPCTGKFKLTKQHKSEDQKNEEILKEKIVEDK